MSKCRKLWGSNDCRGPTALDPFWTVWILMPPKIFLTIYEVTFIHYTAEGLKSMPFHRLYKSTEFCILIHSSQCYIAFHSMKLIICLHYNLAAKHSHAQWAKRQVSVRDKVRDGRGTMTLWPVQVWKRRPNDRAGARRTLHCDTICYPPKLHRMKSKHPRKQSSIGFQPMLTPNRDSELDAE